MCGSIFITPLVPNENHGSQSISSPWELVKYKFLGPAPDLLSPNLWGRGPGIPILTSPLGDSGHRQV